MAGHEDALPTPASCDITPSDRRRLGAQLGRAKAAVNDLATLAAAERAGFVDSDPRGRDAPASAHVLMWDRMDARFDIDEPGQLLFDGHLPTSRLSASVYYVVGHRDGAPDGFAGPLDVLQQHARAYFESSVMAAGDHGEEADMCAARGGVPGRYDGWMLHAWVAPGTSNPDGFFAVEGPGYTPS